MLKTEHLLSRLSGSFSLLIAFGCLCTPRSTYWKAHWTRGDSGKRPACKLPSKEKAGLGLSCVWGSVEGQMWPYVVLAFALRAFVQLRSQLSHRTTMKLSLLLWKLVTTPLCSMNAACGLCRVVCERGA